MERISIGLLRHGIESAFRSEHPHRAYAEGMIRTALREMVLHRSGGLHTLGMVEHVTIGDSTLAIWVHPEAAASVALSLSTIPGINEIPYIRHLEDMHPLALVTASVKLS